MLKIKNMRKVILALVLCAWMPMISSAQSNPCSSAQFQAADSGQWSIAGAIDWLIIADIYGSSGNFCLPDGCFYLYGFGTNQWVNQNDLSITVNDTIVPLEIQYADSTGYVIAFFSWNGTSGCPDPGACNYSPSATCGDYATCTYDCYGCMDSNAVNFNPNATIDNYSCCYSQWATLESNDSMSYSVYNGLGQYLTSGDNYSGFPNSGFCYGPGCYTIYVQGIDEDPFTAYLVSNGQTLQTEFVAQGWWTTFQHNNGGISGCTDANACNYNPEATCIDGSCEYNSCQGCTDSTATNFNPIAIHDNGTCCYGDLMSINVPMSVSWYYYNQNNYAFGTGSSATCIHEGCGTFYAYNNVYEAFDYSITDANGNSIASGNSLDPATEWDDISTIHIPISNGEIVSGCSDPNACNFNPMANCLDYTLCDYSCQGCTNPAAYNFNENATIDNGTCCMDNYFEVTAFSAGGMVSWSAIDGYGNMVGSTDFSVETSGFCAFSSCITFYANDLMGMPFSLIIKRNGVVIYTNDNITEYGFSWSYDNNQVIGCADPSACNYNPNANCFLYNICDYSCLGCTDPTAVNFNPAATVDNGTCCTSDNWQSISASGDVFFYVAANDGTQSQQGFYPDNTGFCMNSNCYMLYAFGTSGQSVDMTISNPNMGDYYSFSTNTYLGYNIENIGINEIAGCTDPIACNYNPNATCDYGYCEYYCGGCLDPQALNYSQNALFDDGTCSYEVVSPVVGMQLVPDENNGQFYVMIALTEMGNVSPYAVTNTANDGMMTMMDPGTAMAGPFNCGDSVQFHVHAMGYNMNTIMISPTYRMDCAAANVSEALSAPTLVFPNPARDIVQINGLKNNTQITVRDTQGRIVYSERSNTANTNVNCTEWSNGIYFIELKDKDGTQQHKVQVLH
jgi:hypothetical protein